MKTEKAAKLSFDRTHRDMNFNQQRHIDLMLQLDEEAQESRVHLH